MERVILATLRWDTAAVTPQDFLPHFLASLEERGGCGGSGETEGELLSTLRRHSDTLAAMCACDSRFLGAPPSLVAAASLNCALRGLRTEGRAQLAGLGEALAELCRTDLVSGPAESEAERRPVRLASLGFSSSRGMRGTCLFPVRTGFVSIIRSSPCLALQAVLQCYSEMIECALRQRLRGGLQLGPTEKDDEVENERAGTPTDMRDIDF